MPLFKVTGVVSYSISFTKRVEADDEDDAEEMVREMAAHELDVDLYDAECDSIDVDEVEEVDEEKDEEDEEEEREVDFDEEG
jgi:hypothetical protein